MLPMVDFIKRMARSKGTRQSQAAPLNRPLVERMLAAADERLIDHRNKALLGVAYDTLVRRSELVALTVDDIAFADDGSGTALIKRSKGDQAGEGSIRYLASDTVEMLRVWLDGADIAEGAVFRSITKGGTINTSLSAGEVSKVLTWRGQPSRRHWQGWCRRWPSWCRGRGLRRGPRPY